MEDWRPPNDALPLHWHFSLPRVAASMRRRQLGRPAMRLPVGPLFDFPSIAMGVSFLGNGLN
jgi:hypothetical protein